MADASYQPLVHRRQGGNKLVVASGGELDVESGGALKLAGTAISATATEINQVADVSTRVVEYTVSAAVPVGVMAVELNHISTAVELTIASAANHAGIFTVKNTSASGTESHKLTLTAGTFNGTNNVATLNAGQESLVIFFDSAGAGEVILNTDSVALS